MKKRRVMLKLSGEALAGDKRFGFDEATCKAVAGQVKEAVDEGVEIAVVIGGGNFWRGRESDAIDRYKADQIGMLATVMNCIYVSEIFRSSGIDTEIFGSFPISDMIKLFSKDDASKALQSGKVVFLAGGTGHPYFSTDTAVALRAVELMCSEILLAKAVDGVYDKDPAKYDDAVKFDSISIEEVVNKKLGVIDLASSVICMENNMPLAVFSLKEKDGIKNALKGIINGTKITV